MLEPLIPHNEAQRLAALGSLNILDTPPEERFDRITRLAQRLFDVPIALVSLVDANRQWFKSCQGLDALETPRNISFCGHAILNDGPLVIADAALDPRFADNPLVTDAPHIRFYAGHPLKASDGSRLGTLCIIDRKPRQLDQPALDALHDLAALAEEELNLADIKGSAAILRSNENRLRAILDNVVDGILTIDDKGKVETMNSAAERIFGYTAAEVIGQNIKMLMPEPYQAQHDAYLSRYLGTGEARIIGKGREVTGLRKNGSTFPMGLAVSEMQIEGRRMFTGIVRDVSDVRGNQNRLRTILDNVVDGILTIDGKGTVETMNLAAEKIFGYTVAEVIGRNVKMLMPAPYQAEHDNYLSRYIATGEARIIGKGREVTGLRKDGSTFPMELAVGEMQVEGRRMFTGIVRDITERKIMESLKNEFVSMVSHELRTPLTSIRGSLGLVAGGVTGELGAQTKSLVDIAYKNSERLVRLINDILDIEKIESGKMRFEMRPSELTPLILQSLEANHGYGEQYGVKFVVTQALPEVMVNVDTDRMMQVLSNLLSNAAKFSPSGATVDVSIARQDDFVRVSVSDHGNGITETFKSKIFQKFSQADSSDTRQKGGTGLGLSITKAIVETMGGRIGFESQEGSGTTFFFDLPEWQKVCSLPVVNHTHVLAASKARVLICEDDQDIATLLGLMLKQGGFETDIAHDAAQAKDFLARGNYAAMTLDLALPGQDGISLIRELKSLDATRELPIIVISAKAQQGRTELLGTGFEIVDWLGKPIDQETLILDVSRSINSLGKIRPNVLHVEDDEDIRQIIGAVATDVAEFDYAANLGEAREKLAHHQYQLIILDVVLPDGTGWELLPVINKLDPQPPVLIFSAHDIGEDEASKVAAALVKSSASNQELVETISALIRQPRHH